MKPPKVVRLIARLNTGGPARHVVLLCDRMAGLGYESLLVHGAIGADEDSLEHLVTASNIRSEFVRELGRSVKPLDDFRALRTLIRVLNREKPSVVHTHTSKGGALGRMAAVLYNLTVPAAERCAIVHTFHGHVFAGYFGVIGSFVARLFERALAKVSDAILVVSPQQARELIDRYNIASEEKVHVVPLGLDLTRFPSTAERRPARTAFGYGDEDIVLGFVGRLVPVKAPGLLLDAFAAAFKKDRRLRLVLVGDGQLRKGLESQVRSHGIASYVQFAGWRHDLPAVYSALDMLVLSSINEGTPVALIEAAAAGLPVVATRAGGVPDVITHGRHGLLTPVGDSQALSNAILELARSKEDRARMGQTAQREIPSRFAPDRLITDIHLIYERSLLMRRGSAGTRVSAAAAPRAES
jgi:glycosyltransferase involved in cell wall biosynthesis